MPVYLQCAKYKSAANNKKPTPALTKVDPVCHLLIQYRAYGERSLFSDSLSCSMSGDLFERVRTPSTINQMPTAVSTTIASEMRERMR